jgi:sugar lactone lactonase YvrE
LNNPWGITFDSAGNLYIADAGNNRIRKVSNGTITTLVGGGSLSLSGPIAVAADASGNVYIADTNNSVVRKWSNGVTTTAVQVPAPTGVAVDASGNLYISDYRDNLVLKATNGALSTLVQVTGPVGLTVDGAGNLFVAAFGSNFVGELPASGNGSIVAGSSAGLLGYTGDGGGATSATLNSPAAVAVDAGGNIYIADYNNFVVRKVSGGVISTVAGSIQGFTGDNGSATSALLFSPSSTATGPAGELYIVDSLHNTIRKVLNGVITTVAGTGAPGYTGDGGAATAAQLNSPWGVAVDSAGNLYISDSGNQVIRKVTGGVISTVAGIGGTANYNGDNISATTAALNGPSGIALDAAGNLYIADFGNQRIRKVSNGTITTAAGNGTQGYNGDGIAPTSAELANPVDVKVDSAGNIYIADQGNNLIREVGGGVINTIVGIASVRAGGFAGDGGAATSAQINAPSGIALDASGALYIADTSNNVIRKVTAGTINTIAGNGVAAFAGDGGPPTGASLNTPLGVSVGPSGQVYIADSGNNLIRATNLVCNNTVTPTSVQATAAGGTFPISVNTSSFCSWSVSGLPTWITIPGPSSGTGAGAVNLLIAPDAGAPRNATISVAGVPVAVNQAACTYAINPGTQVFPAAGGNGTIAITTASVCAWTVVNTNSYVTFTGGTSGAGNGTVNFTVASSASARTGTFTVAGLPFTVIEQAATIPGLSFVGSMSHIAAEENWVTTFTMVNTTASPNQVRLNLFGDNGSPLQIPFSLPQQPNAGVVLGASTDSTLSPFASLVVNTAGQGILPVQVGSAQVSATGALGGFAIFHRSSDAQEAVVPLETRNAGSYTLAYDNTNGLVLGVAVENVSPQTANGIHVVIRDDTGATIASGSISLPGSGHSSFVLSDNFPATANKRGTAEFDPPAGGQISVLGIRFTPQVTPQGTVTTLTTVPALANVGTGGGSIAHLATGNGWQTTFVLVNTGSTAAQANLNFFADVTGAPLPIPISFPQTGSTVTTASSVTQTLAAGATLIVQSLAPVTDPTPTVGAAQLTTNGNVSGFVIFRYTLNGQEAVVPLESRNSKSYVLAFDNTSSTATGVAINNVSSQAVNVSVVVRDDAGNQIATDTLNLAGNAHQAFTLVSDKYPGTANIRGTIEFDTPNPGQIGALGIRIPIAHTFTTLPALVK